MRFEVVGGKVPACTTVFHQYFISNTHIRWKHKNVLYSRNDPHIIFILIVISLSLSSVGDSSGTCGDPGTPSHGSRDESDFRIRSKVHFRCSVGYELFGSTERMCFPNGTWSGTQPSCKRKHLQHLT